jgi:hypothetical protein
LPGHLVAVLGDGGYRGRHRLVRSEAAVVERTAVFLGGVRIVGEARAEPWAARIGGSAGTRRIEDLRRGLRRDEHKRDARNSGEAKYHPDDLALASQKALP